MGGKARLGEILIEAGEIDSTQLEAALREQQESGRPLGMTLVHMGVLQEDTLVRTLAEQLSLPMARLHGKRVSAEVLDLVPFDLAEKHHCFPLFVKGEGDARALYLAMQDASDTDAIGEVADRAGIQVRPVLVAPSEIEEALHRQYDVIASSSSPPLEVAEDEVEEDHDGEPFGALPPPSEVGLDAADLASGFDPGGESVEFDDAGLSEPSDAFDTNGLSDDDFGGGELAVSPLPNTGPSLSGGPLGDSLPDFGPEMLSLESQVEAAPALEPPGSHAPERAHTGPVAQDAILRALTQLLVEKGIFTREELIARVHRESGGDDS